MVISQSSEEERNRIKRKERRRNRADLEARSIARIHKTPEGGKRKKKLQSRTLNEAVGEAITPGAGRGERSGAKA